MIMRIRLHHQRTAFWMMRLSAKIIQSMGGNHHAVYREWLLSLRRKFVHFNHSVTWRLTIVGFRIDLHESLSAAIHHMISGEKHLEAARKVSLNSNDELSLERFFPKLTPSSKYRVIAKAADGPIIVRKNHD